MQNNISFANKKGWVTFVVIGCLLLLLTVWLINRTYQNITVEFDDTKVDVFISNKSLPRRQIKSNIPINIQNGTYTLAARGDGITPINKTIEVTKDTTHFTINELSLTNQKLASLYQKQQSAILDAIYSEYPRIKTDYTIKNDQLYHYGEYFGATLHYNNKKSLNRDTLHILLKKEDDTWSVLSTPPMPILSAPEYPSVPKNILSAINRDR